MRLCPACGTVQATAGWDCGKCGFSAETRFGFPVLAPELANTGEGFDPALFSELAALEARNYWFRARNRLIVWALRRYFPALRDFLEVGCGTGYVLQGVAEAFPGAALRASEAHPDGLQYAASRVPRASLMQMDARRVPFDSEYDVIGAFDVIEHIPEDEIVLGELHRAVKPGGGVVLTVPQHPSLWSEFDVRAHHVRRYTRDDLARKLARAGFGIVKMTSFVSVLLPLMMLSRRIRRVPAEDYDPLAELRVGRVVNVVLEGALDAERLLIRAGMSLPCGGSLLVVARRLA